MPAIFDPQFAILTALCAREFFPRAGYAEQLA
jgi:hypothetical protein